MKRKSIAGVAALGLCLLPVASISLTACSPIAALTQNTHWSRAELEQEARDITVKVLVGESRASGVLVAQEGQDYFVLTNRHVTDVDDNYRIEAPDGEVYTATKIESKFISPNYDLAILYFNTSEFYSVAKMGDWDALPAEGEAAFVAGFPLSTEELKFTGGKIEFVPPQSLAEGYRIGYTNEIEQGMSGGAVLNQNGEVIGVNGMSTNPVLSSAYVFVDGTRPTPDMIKQMQRFSWGIPLTEFKTAAPEAVAYLFPPEDEIPVGMVAGDSELPDKVAEINEIAQGISVRIAGRRQHGSGAIVAKQGRTYYVLTAYHVVKAPQEYTLMTADGKEHRLKEKDITPLEGLDLAVVKFRSRQNYQVVELGNYKIEAEERFYVFVSGFPQEQRMLSAGIMFSEEQSSLQAKNVTSASLSRGYELVYTNITQDGMSGGAVLDSLGRLVGLHGQADGDPLYQVQLGYSLGVPTRTFLGALENAGIKREWMEIADTKPPFVAQEDSDTIQKLFYSVNQVPKNRNERDWLNYGNQLWRLGKNEEAVKAFTIAIQLKPDLHIAWYARGLALSSLRQYNKAAISFQQAVQLRDNFPEAWREWGSALQNLQRYEDALTAYENAINLEPENFALHFNKGWVLGELKRHADARDAYSRALELKSHAFAYTNRGLAYSELKEYNNAIADHNRALQLNPNDAKVYNNRGNAYYGLKQYKKAIADYTKSIELKTPNLHFSYHNLGLVYYDLKEYDKAISHYNQSIKLNPGYTDAYINRGLVYNELQEYEKAIADYNRALNLDPNNAMAYLNRGNTRSNLKEYEKAIADYNRALNLDPNNSDYYIGRGIAYRDSKKYDQAIGDFDRAIELSPKSINAYNSRGITYYELKEYNKAIEDYNRALNLDPKFAMVYVNRGLVYRDSKKYDQAIGDFDRAIELSPKSINAYNSRGITYYELKEYNKAIEDYNRALKLNADYDFSYYNRGDSYYKLEEYEKAIADYNRAIELNPNYTGMYFNRAFAHYELKQYQDSLSDYNRALQLDSKNVAAYFNRSLTHEKLGNTQQAIADARKAEEIWCGNGSPKCQKAKDQLRDLQQ